MLMSGCIHLTPEVMVGNVAVHKGAAALCESLPCVLHMQISSGWIAVPAMHDIKDVSSMCMLPAGT